MVGITCIDGLNEGWMDGLESCVIPGSQTNSLAKTRPRWTRQRSLHSVIFFFCWSKGSLAGASRRQRQRLVGRVSHCAEAIGSGPSVLPHLAEASHHLVSPVDINPVRCVCCAVRLSVPSAACALSLGCCVGVCLPPALPLVLLRRVALRSSLRHCATSHHAFHTTCTSLLTTSLVPTSPPADRQPVLTFPMRL